MSVLNMCQLHKRVRLGEKEKKVTRKMIAKRTIDKETNSKKIMMRQRVEEIEQEVNLNKRL